MKGRHFVSTIILATSLLATVAPTHAALSSSFATQTSDVLFNGVTYITGVKRATYTGLAWRAVGRQAGGISSKDYGSAYYPTAEFEMGLNGAQALARIVTELSSGRPTRLSAQVRTPSADPAALEWTQLGDCDVAYFRVPRLDAASKSAGYFTAAVVPTAFTPMAEKVAGTSAPAAPLPVPFWENGFSVTIPGIDASKVIVVDGITITNLSANASLGAGNSGSSAAPAASEVNANFTLRSTGVTTRGLRDWMLANQTTRPSKREITIQLFASGTTTPLLTLHGIGVGLMSLVPDEEAAESLRSSTATLFVERWEVTAPGATGTVVRSKVDMASPILGLPTGRK